MPVTQRAGDSIPVIAWLGDPPPQGVAESLASIARLLTKWTPEARLIVLWAPAGVEQLSRLPGRTRRPPVIAASEQDPSHGERMDWIRAGADDLVSLAALPIAVARRLKSSPAPASEALANLSQERPHDPTSLVEPLGLPNTSVTPLPRTPSRPPVDAPDDAFPPLRAPHSEDGIPPRVPLWVDALRRYLPVRDEWTSRWGRGGLNKLLELVQIRSGVNGDRADPWGIVDGRPDEPLGWPILVRRGPSRKRKSINVSEAQVVAVGTDGMVLEVPFPVTRRQKLVVDLLVRESEDAQLLLEASWQRRVGPDRWHVGMMIIEMRLRPLNASLQP